MHLDDQVFHHYRRHYPSNQEFHHHQYPCPDVHQHIFLLLYQEFHLHHRHHPKKMEKKVIFVYFNRNKKKIFYANKCVSVEGEINFFNNLASSIHS